MLNASCTFMIDALTVLPSGTAFIHAGCKGAGALQADLSSVQKSLQTAGKCGSSGARPWPPAPTAKSLSLSYLLLPHLAPSVNCQAAQHTLFAALLWPHGPALSFAMGVAPLTRAEVSWALLCPALPNRAVPWPSPAAEAAPCSVGMAQSNSKSWCGCEAILGLVQPAQGQESACRLSSSSKPG